MAKTKAAKQKTAAPFDTQDAAAAFAHFKTRALAASEGVHYNADLDVVPHNVKTALAAIEAHLSRDDVSEEAVLRIRELDVLVLALVYADSRVVAASSPGLIADAQTQQRPLRQALLGYFEIVSMAEFALVPAERVKKIREGKGPIDEARDGINLVALLREFEEALRGLHPFDEERVARLESTSLFLLRHLAPEDAALPPKSDETSEDVAVRDGLWALILRAYDELLLVGAKAWGFSHVHDYLPSLLGRARAKKQEASA